MLFVLPGARITLLRWRRHTIDGWDAAMHCLNLVRQVVDPTGDGDIFVLAEVEFKTGIIGEQLHSTVSAVSRQGGVDMARWRAFGKEQPQLRAEVLLDNLTTHTYAALYEASEPVDARWIARNLAFHYTPKHSDWLNMAEMELSVILRKLSSRVHYIQTLKQELKAIELSRNQAHATVDWGFTTEDARIQLKRLYHSILD